MSSTAGAATTTVGDVRLEQQQAAGWHSPVPYLFGGLAAMMGLITFALLILACSYWKLSGHLDSGESESGGEGEKEGGGPGEMKAVWDSKVLVIMAGQVMPTFLATPLTRSLTVGMTEITTRLTALWLYLQIAQSVTLAARSIALASVSLSDIHRTTTVIGTKPTKVANRLQLTAL